MKELRGSAVSSYVLENGKKDNTKNVHKLFVVLFLVWRAVSAE
jgi:hypothetical protein